MGMSDITFADYFKDWIYREKKGAVRDVTFSKYRITEVWLRKINPTVTVSELDRKVYQDVLNVYGMTHERTTLKDFHTQWGRLQVLNRYVGILVGDKEQLWLKESVFMLFL